MPWEEPGAVIWTVWCPQKKCSGCHIPVGPLCGLLLPGAGDHGGFTSIVWIQVPGAAPGPRPATDLAAISPSSPCYLSECLLFCICSLTQALSICVASPNRRFHVPRILELDTEGQNASGPGAPLEGGFLFVFVVQDNTQHSSFKRKATCIVSVVKTVWKRPS